MPSNYPSPAPSRKPSEEEKAPKHHSKAPTPHKQSSTPQHSDAPSTPSVPYTGGTIVHLPRPHKKPSVSGNLNTNTEASVAPQHGASFVPPSMPPGPYQSLVPSRYPTAVTGTSQSIEDSTMLNRDKTMKLTMLERDTTQCPTQQSTKLDRDTTQRPRIHKPQESGSSQIRHDSYASQAHQSSLIQSVVSYRPATTAPSGTKSLFNRPDDQIMATRQLKIETMSPRDRETQDEW